MSRDELIEERLRKLRDIAEAALDEAEAHDQMASEAICLGDRRYHLDQVDVHLQRMATAEYRIAQIQEAMAV